MVIQLKFYLLCMLSGSEKKVRRTVFLFPFFNKIQDGWQITCYSEELELLHRFVPRKQLTLAICWLDFGVILTSHFHVVYIQIWWEYCISLYLMYYVGRVETRKLCPSGKSSYFYFFLFNEINIYSYVIPSISVAFNFNWVWWLVEDDAKWKSDRLYCRPLY